MKRITLVLITLALVGCVLPTVAQAAARPPTTTVVWSPHPDDETLRLTGYALYAKSKGDIMILVAVTDGGASAVKTRLGITADELMALRRAEQDAAWAALTGGAGKVIRLGAADGKVSQWDIARAFPKVQEIAASYGRRVEHYVAASVYDTHPDHRVVAKSVTYRAFLAGVVSRHSRPPESSSSGTRYKVVDTAAAEAAHNAYRQVGMLSVGSLFRSTHNKGHVSRVVTPGRYGP